MLRNLVQKQEQWPEALVVPSSEVVAAGGRLTISESLLTSGGSSVDGTSISTASVSPTGNALVLAAVHAVAGGGGPSTPTATGNGLTWVEVDTADCDANRRLTVFRAMGASPSAGAITFDFGATSHTSFTWAVVQFTNVDTSGTNGSGAVVQAVPDTAAASTTITGTLAALESANNVHAAFVGLDIQTAITADADFGELAQETIGNGNQRLQAASAVNETACTPTYATADACIVSVEVKAG